jgi:hypothetical protein
MIEHDNGSATFAHSNNIEIGRGRVLWAKATTDTSGIHHPEGWVLPGGRRVCDTFQARAAAVLLETLAGAAQ